MSWFDAHDLLGLIAAVVLALFFFWLGVRVKDPKLRGVGSGAGGGATSAVQYSTLCIGNRPTFLFGKVARDPVEIVITQLYEPSGRELLEPRLLWAVPGGFADSVKIPAGGQEHLYLFVKERGSDDLYIFTKACWGVLNTLPRELTRLPSGIKKYELRLVDSIERQYRFSIIQQGRGSVEFDFKWTMADRLQAIRQGMATIAGAFRSQG